MAVYLSAEYHGHHRSSILIASPVLDINIGIIISVILLLRFGYLYSNKRKKVFFFLLVLLIMH